MEKVLRRYLGRPVGLVEALDPDRFIYRHRVGVWFVPELRALECHVGQELDPRRFRLAIGITTEPPTEMVGRELAVGGAVLRIEERITRCPIIDWDVASAAPNVALLRHLGASDVGPVFGYGCSVVQPGAVRVGDPASVG